MAAGAGLAGMRRRWAARWAWAGGRPVGGREAPGLRTPKPDIHLPFRRDVSFSHGDRAPLSPRGNGTRVVSEVYKAFAKCRPGGRVVGVLVNRLAQMLRRIVELPRGHQGLRE